MARERARRVGGLVPRRGLQRAGAIRLGHAGAEAATRTQGRETAERVSLAGSPHGLALKHSRSRSRRPASSRLFAPVTNRGRRSACSSSACQRRRTSRRWPTSRSPRTRWRTSSSRTPLHRPLRVGPALGAAVAGRRDPASPAAGRVHVRGRAVHAGGLAGARRRDRRRQLRLRDRARHAAPLDVGRAGAMRSARRSWRRCSSARCATRGVPRSGWPSRPGSPTTGLGEHVRLERLRDRRRSRGSTCVPATATIVNAGRAPRRPKVVGRRRAQAPAAAHVMRAGATRGRSPSAATEAAVVGVGMAERRRARSRRAARAAATIASAMPFSPASKTTAPPSSSSR